MLNVSLYQLMDIPMCLVNEQVNAFYSMYQCLTLGHCLFSRPQGHIQDNDVRFIQEYVNVNYHYPQLNSDVKQVIVNLINLINNDDTFKDYIIDNKFLKFPKPSNALLTVDQARVILRYILKKLLLDMLSSTPGNIFDDDDGQINKMKTAIQFYSTPDVTFSQLYEH